ncbi:MAG: DUF374 domain-containing protein [Pseudomonadota bacterium]
MKQSLTNLRRGIANSPALNRGAVKAFVAWLRFVRRTSHWDEDGWVEVEQALAEHGAVVMIVWHQRSFLAPFCFHGDPQDVIHLHAEARAGNFAGAILREFGYRTVALARKGHTNASALKEVLSGLKQGASVGIAVDGPKGPARSAKSFPIQWSRISGKPIFLYAAAARRVWVWPTWDKQHLPMPWTRVALAWRRWDQDVTRKLSEAEMEEYRLALSQALDALTEEVDARVGR